MQHNRVTRAQLEGLGFGGAAVTRYVESGRFVIVDHGVLAIAPVLGDDWGRWMGATLTAPNTYLSHLSAAAAYDCWSGPRRFETVTRPGSGGSRRLGALIVHRSATLAGDVTERRRVPLTTIGRTLIDIAPLVSDRALARAVREAVRLKHITLQELATTVARYRGRRGVKRLAATVARYGGLPLERARSGAEVRAIELIREAGVDLPELNIRRAGEEADLSWHRHRLIIEIDGAPFHRDIGEDARKQAAWRAAGWTVRRLDADDVYDRPHLLFPLLPAPNVRN